MADSQFNGVRTSDYTTRCEGNFVDGESLTDSPSRINISVLELLR
jgi:hypothetical protein